MLKIKSLIVRGETTTRNGVRQSDLPQKMDAAVNEALAHLDGELVSVSVSIPQLGTQNDGALVSLLYKSDAAAAAPAKKK